MNPKHLNNAGMITLEQAMGEQPAGPTRVQLCMAAVEAMVLAPKQAGMSHDDAENLILEAVTASVLTLGTLTTDTAEAILSRIIAKLPERLQQARRGRTIGAA